jgi:1-deoxy-D-xylulose-5-phosphate reductoisomerase
MQLARDALTEGGGLPIALNAANEVAVDAFLGKRLGFSGIPEVIRACLSGADSAISRPPSSLDDVMSIDAWARREAERQVGGQVQHA